MSLKDVDALLSLIVPNSDDPIVASGNEVWLVASMEVNAIDSALVALESEIGFGACNSPNFDCPVHACGRKRVWVARVECDHHDIVYMVFVSADKLKVILEVPGLDGCVIRGGKEILGMDDDASYVVGVGIKGLEEQIGRCVTLIFSLVL